MHERSEKEASEKWRNPLQIGVIFLAFAILAGVLYSERGRTRQAAAEIEELRAQIIQLRSDSREQTSRREEEERRMADAEVNVNFLKLSAEEDHYFKKKDKLLALADKNLYKDTKAHLSFTLAINNYWFRHQNVHVQRYIEELKKKEYQRLSKDYDFTLPERPFCVVVPTYNNAKDFRYAYNLYSIFNQDYTNFKVVIMDDASSDDNFELITQWFQDNPVNQKVVLYQRKDRGTALPNIYQAAHEFCDEEDIMVLLDGDDQLLGVNVFKVMNSVYTKGGFDVAYSNFIRNNNYQSLSYGWSKPYSNQQKVKNMYRDQYTRVLHLRTFKVSTFRKIPAADMQDDNGDWFISAYDEVIFPQLLEFSCGRNTYVDEYLHLYNFGLGTNDLEIDNNRNAKIGLIVRGRKKHEC